MSRVPAASVFALALLGAVAAARAEEPRVEFPLGPVVRAGRPLVVRVPGAERVRAPGTPWALPQGVRGDEFLLQGARPEGGRLTLSVRVGGAEHDVGVDVREPLTDEVTAVLDDTDLAEGDVRVAQTRLPTLREAWLTFDDVRGSFGGASGAVSGALAASRADRAAGGVLEPFLLPPSIPAYRAASEAAGDSPALPRDVAIVLLLLAATEAVLIVLLRREPRGGAGAWRRAAWLAGPPLAALAWLIGGPGLPSGLRATLVVLSAPRNRVALLLVEGRRAGEARFELPAGAGPAALVRFASDGGGEVGVATGDAIEVRLKAGESRLFAYRLPPAPLPAGPAPAPRELGEGPGDVLGEAPGREMRRWLAGLGWRARDPHGRLDAEAAFDDALPSGTGARVIPGAALAIERTD